MTTETLQDQLSRVRQMADGDPQWDLSPNDQAALRAVLDAVPQWQDKPTSPGWWMIYNIRSGEVRWNNYDFIHGCGEGWQTWRALGPLPAPRKDGE